MAKAQAAKPSYENVNGKVMLGGFECLPIIDKCEGCDRTAEFEGKTFCQSYAMPQQKWARGACNFATHVKAELQADGKVKINPLKASKRAARGR